MTEKRFKWDVCDHDALFYDNGAVIDYDDVVDLLNELAEENQQLKELNKMLKINHKKLCEDVKYLKELHNLTIERNITEVKLTKECLNCSLLGEINDGMNITNYCKFDGKTVDKFYSKCHLTEEDKQEINNKKLIEETYIE